MINETIVQTRKNLYWKEKIGKKCDLFLIIFVESLAALHSKLSLRHHPVDELAGSPDGELRVIIDVFVEINPSVVQQFKWSHGIAQP